MMEEEFDKEKTPEDIVNYNIRYWSYNRSYDELIKMYNHQEIIIPDMQRGFVWKKDQASRLIESILLGLPIPSVFLTLDQPKVDDKYIIVDGLQRLITLDCYVNEKPLPNQKAKDFKLSTVVHSRWAKKRFHELSMEDQLKIKRSTINIIEFLQFDTKNEEGRYLIFERINTGSEKLYPQQIRNSIYHGKFNDLLLELGKDPDYLAYYEKRTVDVARLQPVENILRFFAIYDYVRFKEKTSIQGLKNFLNEYMNLFQKLEQNEEIESRYQFFEHYKGSNLEEVLEEKRQLFQKTFQFVRKTFGVNAFQQYDEFQKRYKAVLHRTIFEGLMVAVAISLEEREPLYCDSMKKRDEIISRDFWNRFQASTTSYEHIHERVNAFLKNE